MVLPARLLAMGQVDAPVPTIYESGCHLECSLLPIIYDFVI